jgi:hypothetical protein
MSQTIIWIVRGEQVLAIKPGEKHHFHLTLRCGLCLQDLECKILVLFQFGVETEMKIAR